MSYTHATDNHVVNFEEEVDYLEARTEYLYGSHEEDLFINFLQQANSEGRFNIESIYLSEPATFTFSGDDNTITFDDTNNIYTDGSISDITFSNDVLTPSNVSATHGSFGNPSINITSNFHDYLADIFAEEKKEEIKEEPPEDPIDSRFDILDL